jgi:transposase
MPSQRYNRDRQRRYLGDMILENQSLYFELKFSNYELNGVTLNDALDNTPEWNALKNSYHANELLMVSCVRDFLATDFNHFCHVAVANQLDDFVFEIPTYLFNEENTEVSEQPRLADDLRCPAESHNHHDSNEDLDEYSNPTTDLREVFYAEGRGEKSTVIDNVVKFSSEPRRRRSQVGDLRINGASRWIVDFNSSNDNLIITSHHSKYCDVPAHLLDIVARQEDDFRLLLKLFAEVQTCSCLRRFRKWSQQKSYPRSYRVFQERRYSAKRPVVSTQEVVDHLKQELPAFVSQNQSVTKFLRMWGVGSRIHRYQDHENLPDTATIYECSIPNFHSGVGRI